MEAKTNYVLVSEQQVLLEGQVRAIKDRLGEFQIWKIPAEGWSLSQQLHVVKDVQGTGGNYIFATPIPTVMAKISYLSGKQEGQAYVGPDIKVFVLHAAPQTGWQLVEI